MRIAFIFGTAFLFMAVSGCRTTVNVLNGEHPYYIHASADLREALWMIEHRPGNWAQTNDEIDAAHHIEAAIGEIKKAAIDDGKNVEEHLAADEPNEHNDRLHESIDYLKKARQDISHDEDNRFAQGLQARAYNHIDAAIIAVRRALRS